MHELEEQIFKESGNNFDELALSVFRYQAHYNEVYARYIQLLDVNPESVNSIDSIPFLPISLFKTHRVYTGENSVEAFFTSSGTTGAETSKHHVAKLSIYERSFTQAFELFYGKPSEYCILALLPSYLEREGSSLVYMANKLINESGNPNSGFFLHNHKDLLGVLLDQEQKSQSVILIGVTFALLDLASRVKLKLENTTIIETGGMKGRGKELVRSEMHSILCEAFDLKAVHSEYGMTELLSQAYSKGDGAFNTPPWMRILTRDPYDPLTLLSYDAMGAINIIDLANIYSCSFIQSDDLGVVHPDGSFEVLGRMDGSQIRGCNLLVL